MAGDDALPIEERLGRLLRHLGIERAHFAGDGGPVGRLAAVRPLAIRAMADLGIDISGQTSKTLEGYLGAPFDAVVTVCDDANESCPVFPGARARLHWSLPDPSRAAGSEAEQLAVYRRVRDELRRRITAEVLPRVLPANSG